MGYICLNCMTEYIKENIKYNVYKEKNQCPKIDCLGFSLAEIDDMILPVIRLLNIKGYFTNYCCSGHGYQSQERETYISFDEDFVPKNMVIPKGFELENESYYIENYSCHKPDNGNICIRKTYSDFISREEYEQELYNTMIQLMKWAIDLPDNK